MAGTAEFVSQLRATYSVNCQRHHQLMAFVSQGNGSGVWRCEAGCEVAVAINWKSMKTLTNGGDH